jgi:hypothetical protein
MRRRRNFCGVACECCHCPEHYDVGADEGRHAHVSSLIVFAFEIKEVSPLKSNTSRLTLFAYVQYFVPRLLTSRLSRCRHSRSSSDAWAGLPQHSNANSPSSSCALAPAALADARCRACDSWTIFSELKFKSYFKYVTVAALALLHKITHAIPVARGDYEMALEPEVGFTLSGEALRLCSFYHVLPLQKLRVSQGSLPIGERALDKLDAVWTRNARICVNFVLFTQCRWWRRRNRMRR